MNYSIYWDVQTGYQMNKNKMCYNIIIIRQQ